LYIIHIYTEREKKKREEDGEKGMQLPVFQDTQSREAEKKFV
jgi:hypothetical protein